MTTYVAADLRRLVELRANHLCEYCLIHADDTYLGCQVDHVIAEKHGGATDADNLSYACTFCNRSKERKSGPSRRAPVNSRGSSIRARTGGRIILP